MGTKECRYLLALLLLVIAAGAGCDKIQGTNSGQIVLSSQFDFELATLTGYHFESSSYVSFPSVEGEIPDIVVDQFRLLDGSIKPGFSSPDNLHGFALAGNFSNAEEAESYFKNQLKEVAVNLVYEPSSDTVRQYQVWILKTSPGNYVKLQVLDIEEVENEFGKYNNVTIDYVYQPDGSSTFE